MSDFTLNFFLPEYYLFISEYHIVVSKIKNCWWNTKNFICFNSKNCIVGFTLYCLSDKIVLFFLASPREMSLTVSGFCCCCCYQCIKVVSSWSMIVGRKCSSIISACGFLLFPIPPQFLFKSEFLNFLLLREKGNFILDDWFPFLFFFKTSCSVRERLYLWKSKIYLNGFKAWHC